MERFFEVIITSGLGSSKKAVIRTLPAAADNATYFFPATDVPTTASTIPTDSNVVFSTGRKGLGPTNPTRPAAAIIALSGAKIAANAPTPAAPRRPKTVSAKNAEQLIVQAGIPAAEHALQKRRNAVVEDKATTAY